ncbi:hypothetical protein F5Y12DRAFT_714233 [Xylaria sp. FL1777]|nr:hypothetical protein F5Y12DRAFT_714233 [Xylaria sp. FL1777]
MMSPVSDDMSPSSQETAPHESEANGKDKGKGQANEPWPDDEASPSESVRTSLAEANIDEPEAKRNLADLLVANGHCDDPTKPIVKESSSTTLTGWARLFRYDPFLPLLLGALQNAGIEIPEPDKALKTSIGREVDFARLQYLPTSCPPIPDNLQESEESSSPETSDTSSHKNARKKANRAVRIRSIDEVIEWDHQGGSGDPSISNVEFRMDGGAKSHNRDLEGVTLKDESSIFVGVRNGPDTSGHRNDNTVTDNTITTRGSIEEADSLDAEHGSPGNSSLVVFGPPTAGEAALKTVRDLHRNRLHAFEEVFDDVAEEEPWEGIPRCKHPRWYKRATTEITKRVSRFFGRY